VLDGRYVVREVLFGSVLGRVGIPVHLDVLVTMTVLDIEDVLIAYIHLFGDVFLLHAEVEHDFDSDYLFGDAFAGWAVFECLHINSNSQMPHSRWVSFL
jgi:hypothetical protein